jgi:tetratricopeptide (TPR) repeat protein
LAFLRAVCCENLQDYRAAALFFADALKWNLNDPDLLSLSVAALIMMVHERRLAEAEVYVSHQLELLPNPLAHAAASLLRFYQAKAAETLEERQRLLKSQLAHCDSAWDGFMELPESRRKSLGTQMQMALCLESGAFGALRSGDRDTAAKYCDRAVELAPSLPWPHTIRGFVAYPSKQAVGDFLAAERLGERKYVPYYYLAHDALVREDYRAAAEWCDKALARSPGREVQAQLYEWLAICKGEVKEWFNLDAIRELFGRAQELDPGNPRIERNRSLFESARAESEPAAKGLQWSTAIAHPPEPWREEDERTDSYTPHEVGVAIARQDVVVTRILTRAA